MCCDNAHLQCMKRLINALWANTVSVLLIFLGLSAGQKCTLQLLLQANKYDSVRLTAAFWRSETKKYKSPASPVYLHLTKYHYFYICHTKGIIFYVHMLWTDKEASCCLLCLWSYSQLNTSRRMVLQTGILSFRMEPVSATFPVPNNCDWSSNERHPYWWWCNSLTVCVLQRR